MSQLLLTNTSSICEFRHFKAYISKTVTSVYMFSIKLISQILVGLIPQHYLYFSTTDIIIYNQFLWNLLGHHSGADSTGTIHIFVLIPHKYT